MKYDKITNNFNSMENRINEFLEENEMKKKSLKRALLCALLAMVICVSMLIGATFAWFTDSVTSAGNKIIAGSLDVDLSYKNYEGKWISISEDPNPIFGGENSIAATANNADTLWEPGKTQVVYFAISNNGSLALKYQVVLTVVDPDGSKMYEVMQFAIVPDAEDSVDAWKDLEADTKITPVEGTQVVTKDVPLSANSTHNFALVVHMNEEAGNEYQGKSVEFDITVLATQYTEEEDSYDDQYDFDSEYFIDATTAGSLSAALDHIAPGGTIKLAEGVDYGAVEIKNSLKNVTIMGNDAANVRFNVASTAVLDNVTFTDLDVYFEDNSSAYVDGGIINIDAGAKVTNLVVENSVLTGKGGRSCIVGVSEPTAEITVRNCYIDGTKYLVYGSAPINELTITGCEVSNVNSWLVMLNAGDAVGANLTIDGCTFNNCTGGIAKYLGSSQPDGATTVFTNNTLDANCKGHDGNDAKWFTIPAEASTVTVSGNTLDGNAWNPGVAQGLGKS